jgi:uncharacterized membrane protein (UPF0182 family)
MLVAVLFRSAVVGGEALTDISPHLFAFPILSAIFVISAIRLFQTIKEAVQALAELKSGAIFIIRAIVIRFALRPCVVCVYHYRSISVGGHDEAFLYEGRV